MAGLFGGMKSAFSGWNKADANGLTGMQRLGNFGSAMQGQAPMYAPPPGNQQSQPAGQQGAKTGLADRMNLFGAQMQDIGDQNPPPPPPSMMGHLNVNMPGLPGVNQQQNVQALLQRIYGGR